MFEKSEDVLLLEVLKLEGKLMALQRGNGLTSNRPVSSVSSEHILSTKLSHTVSAISTDCPDGSSTTEAMDTACDGDAEEDASSVSDDE